MRSSILFPIMLLLFGGIVFAQQATPTPTQPPKEMRLDRVPPPPSIASAISAKSYFSPKDEGFRIKLPESYSSYVASKPATNGIEPVDGSLYWVFAEAEIYMMFAYLDQNALTKFTAEQKFEVHSRSLDQLVNKEGTTKIYDRVVTVNGLAAKEAKYTIGGKTYLARTLIAGSRMFVFVVALSDKVAEAETLVKQSLDSFEVVK